MSGVPVGWRPRMVALDIDGTLLRWADDATSPDPEMTARVRDAVRRARAAGAHVVLEIGRAHV